MLILESPGHQCSVRRSALLLLLGASVTGAYSLGAQHPAPCDRPLSPWLIAGTYTPEAASRDHPIPLGGVVHGVDETTLEPRLGSPSPGSPAYLRTWHVVATNPDGRIDFHDVYPLARYSGEVTYAVTYITSPADRVVLLGVESDDRVWAWLNGARLLDKGDHFFGENLDHAPDTAVLHLRRGVNRLLYKVADNGVIVGMGAWLLPSSPDPTADLIISATPTPIAAGTSARPAITLGPIRLTSRASLSRADSTLSVVLVACVTRWGDPKSTRGLTLTAGGPRVDLPDGTPGVPETFAVPIPWMDLVGAKNVTVIARAGDREVARVSAPVTTDYLLSLLSHPIEIDSTGGDRASSRRDGSVVLRGLTLDTLPGRSLVRVRESGWREIVDGAKWARVFTGDSTIPVPGDSVARMLLASVRDSSKREYHAIVDRWMRPLTSIAERMHRDTIDAIGNSHIDAAWLWRVHETQDAVDATWSTATKLMGYYPYMHFAASTAQYYAWMEQRDTITLRKIKALERAGRWHLVGGWWVEPDENMPSGESLVRQGLYGQRLFMRLFGHTATVAWTPDSFGYPWTLPQILAKSGFDSFITQKIRSNVQNQWPASRNVFWWEGPDGTKLLTYIPYGYDHNLNGPDLAEQFTATVDSSASRRMLVLYGVGDHGGGPTAQMLDRAADMSRAPTFPVLRDVAPESSLAKMRSDLEAAGPAGAPVIRDELYLEHHRGVFTTHADMKRWNRRMEALLSEAELAATMSGSHYPSAALTEAWERTLFNQFHDLLSGTGIDSIYHDAIIDYNHADSLAHDALVVAISRMTDSLDTRGSGQPFAIFNPSAFVRTETIRLPMIDGSEDTVRVTVPATAIRIIHSPERASAQARFSSLAAGVPSTLETTELRAEIDQTTGALARLYDKRAGRDVLVRGSNALVMVAGHLIGDDAWNIDDLNGARTWLARDVVVSPARRVGDAWIVEARMAADSVRVIQRYVLRDAIPRLDVETTVDWHQSHQFLKAALVLAFHDDSSHAEIPYGVIGQPMSPVSKYDSARFEVPMQRFVDVDARDGSYGVAFVNDSKYGYSAHGDTLFLSLLRAPKYPDSTADMGTHHFMYSIVPHTGDWRAPAVREAATAINAPLVVIPVAAHAGTKTVSESFATLSGPGVEMTAVKRAEDGDAVVMRLVETAGRPADATVTLGAALASATTVTEADLLEQPIGPASPISRKSITMHLAPWEIRTILIH